MFRSLCILALAVFSALLVPVSGSASPVSWQSVAAGIQVGTYTIVSDESGLKSDVLLVRLSPGQISFTLGVGNDVAAKRSDAKSLTVLKKGVVGINANFFDTAGDPIGVVIRDGTILNKLHRGGKLLNDIFFIRDNKAFIVNRDEFDPSGVSIAVQAGPRLLKDGKTTQVISKDLFNRRSGLAVTENGDLVLFATKVRFPGASFQQLQTMLSSLELGVRDALCFDGGGSSQLYVRKFGNLTNEQLVSGGDVVPVVLVAVPK